MSMGIGNEKKMEKYQSKEEAKGYEEKGYINMRHNFSWCFSL